MKSAPVLPPTRCPHEVPCPTVDLGGGWVQRVAPEHCGICPDGPVGNKYMIGGDMAVKRIGSKRDEAAEQPEHLACSRVGCLVRIGRGNPGHPGPCLLFDYDEPKGREDLDWSHPAWSPGKKWKANGA